MAIAKVGLSWSGEAIVPARRWHVLEAREGRDFSLCQQLTREGFECWRPVDVVTVTRRVRVGGVMKMQKSERKVARFGRYLFINVALGPYVRSAIETDPDVVGFLRGAGGEAPAVVPDDLIAFYRAAPARTAREDAPFSVGDRVRIAKGPATGVAGVVRELQRASVMIAVGESAGGVWAGKLLVPLEHLELVEAGKAPAPKGVKRERRASAA